MKNLQIESQEEELEAISELNSALENGASLPDAIRLIVSDFPLQSSFIADYAMQVTALGSREVLKSPEILLQTDPMAAVIERVVRRKEQARSVAGFESLFRQAETILGSASRLAHVLSISHSLLTKLDRGLIQFATIPATFIDEAAAQLRVSRNAMAAYLQQPPRLAPAAAYKSRKRPTSGVQQTFREALASSLANGELSQEHVERWLAMPEH